MTRGVAGDRERIEVPRVTAASVRPLPPSVVVPPAHGPDGDAANWNEVSNDCASSMVVPRTIAVVVDREDAWRSGSRAGAGASWGWGWGSGPRSWGGTREETVIVSPRGRGRNRIYERKGLGVGSGVGVVGVDLGVDLGVGVVE